MSPHDDLLRAARTELERQLGPARDAADEIAAALDGYVRAHELARANEFAAANGLPVIDGPRDVGDTALKLRNLVAALPELRRATADAAGGQNDEPLHVRPTDSRDEPSRAGASAVRRATMEIPTLEEAQRRLAAEFDTAPFASMRLEEFLLYAEEFAAAARALQERTGGDALSMRVIRRLSAMVHERDLPRRVFGLSRAHAADWQTLADEARARRLKALSEAHRAG